MKKSSIESPVCISNPDSYMNTHEVSAYLGVCPRTICTWIKTGVISCHRIKRVIRFRRCDVDAMFDKFKSKPVQGPPDLSTAIVTDGNIPTATREPRARVEAASDDQRNAGANIINQGESK